MQVQRNNKKVERVLILGKKFKANAEKADARTDRKQHALQEAKTDGNLEEASATLDRRHWARGEKAQWNLMDREKATNRRRA